MLTLPLLASIALAQDVDDDILEFEVTAERVVTDATEQVLSIEEVLTLPGTSGDPVRVVQNLPGVTRPPLNIGQLVIRGSAPEDSATYLDGGRIPLVFHFSGLTTVVAADSLSEVAYLPGSYGVRYGRTQGGVVDLRTKPDPPDKRRTFGSIDLYQGTLFSEFSVGQSGGLSFSARRSWIDSVLDPILDGGGRFQLPRFYDFQARAWAIDAGGGRWDALFIASDDRFRLLSEDGGAVQIGLGTSFQKLRLQRIGRLRGGFSTETTLFGGPEAQTFTFDGDGEAFEKPVLVSLRQELRRPVTDERLGLRFGLDLEGGLDRYSYNIPGFGLPEAGETYLLVPGAYAELSAPLGPLVLTPGVRTDLLATEQGWLPPAVDPRLGATLQLGPGTLLRAGTGRHSQFPETRALLSEGDGNPDLTAQWALQSSAGVRQRLAKDLSFEVTGYWHELFDQVSGREDAFRFFTGPPPTGPMDTAPYANDGTGRILGVESLLRLTADRTTALVSLTVSRSLRADRPGDALVPFQYDQPVTFNALVSRAFDKGWRLGARIRASSGFAYTPVANRVYDLDGRAFEPIYGDPGSARLPTFFSLDARVDKEWQYRNGKVAVYLDLQNATNTTNPEVMSWTYDYGEEAPVESLPLLPSFGVRVER